MDDLLDQLVRIIDLLADRVLAMEDRVGHMEAVVLESSHGKVEVSDQSI